MKKNIYWIIALLFIFSNNAIIAQNTTDKPIADTTATTVQFRVEGACEMCKERIEGVAHKLKVNFAEWVIETNMLTVTYDSTKLNRLKIEKKLKTGM